MAEKTYADTIRNTGTQVVPAPKGPSAPKKGTVKKGGDLRGGGRK